MRSLDSVVELSGGWCAIGLVVAVNGDCLELGRHAAWRPGTIGMVWSSWPVSSAKRFI